MSDAVPPSARATEPAVGVRAPLAREVVHLAWADLPLVSYAVYAVAIAHAQIANLDPARLEHVPAAIFPLFVVWGVYALRAPTASLAGRVLGATVCLGAPAAIAASWWLAELGVGRVVLSPDELRGIYELSAVAHAAILMVHATTGPRRWLAFFLGPAAVYGVLLENGGILLGYFAELHYRAYLGPLPAPLATMCGWVMLFYVVTWITWEVRRLIPPVRQSPVASAAVATGAALALDLQIDPLATAVGFWVWDPRLAPGLLGVPVLNFVAWACAVFPFSLALFLREQTCGLSPGEIALPAHRGWMWRRLPAVLAGAAILFLTTMTTIEGGFDGPTYSILRSAAVRFGVLPGGPPAWSPGSGEGG